MSSRAILAFTFDEENEDKIVGHGLTPWRVAQILENEHLVIRNRKQRRALYLVIGRDHGGSCIAVPVEPTHDPTCWRPVTAWLCKPHEEARSR